MSFYLQSLEPAFISESDSIYFFKRYEYCKMKSSKESSYYPLSTIVYDLTKPGSYYDYSPQEYTINGKEKIREIFYYFDRNCSNKLELKEIQRFIHKLQIKLPLDANELKESLILMDIEVYNEVEDDDNNNFSLTFDQFYNLYKRLGQTQFNEHIIKLSLNYMNHYPLFLTLHNLRKYNANQYPLVHKYNSENNNVFDGFDNSEENNNNSTINNNKTNDNNKKNDKNIKMKSEDEKSTSTNNKEENSIKNDEEDDVFDDSSFNNESNKNEKINQTPNDSFEYNDSFDDDNNKNITPFTSSTEDDFDVENSKENDNNNKNDNDYDDDKQQKYIDWINEYENNFKNSFYISNEGEKEENERKEFDRRKYQQFIKHFSNSKSTLYTDKYDFENASNEINVPIKIEDVDKYLYYIYCKVMNKNITGNISKYKLRFKDFKEYINKLIPECIMPPKRIVKYDEKEMIDFEKRLFDKFELSRETYSSPKYIKFKKHFNIKEYIKIRECIKGCLKCIGYSVKYTELIYDIIIDMYYHNKIDEKYFKEEFEKKCIEYNEIEKENRLLDRSKEIYIENKRKENLLYFIISFIFFANPGYIRYSKLKEIFKRNNIELYSNDYIYLLNFQSQFRCSLIHIIKTLPSLLLESIEELEMKENIDICEKYISYIKTFDLLKYISEKLLIKYPMLQINFEENDKKNFLEYLSGERSKDISFDPYKLIIKYYNLPDKYIVEEAIIYSYHWIYSKEGKWYIQMYERIKKCNGKKSKLEMFQKCKIQQIEKIKNEIHTDNSILKDLYYQYLLKYNGLKSEFPKKGIVNEFSFEKYLSDRNKRNEIDRNKDIQELIYEVDNDLLDEKVSLNDYLKDPFSFIRDEEKEKYLNEELVIKTKRKAKINKEKENKEIKKFDYLKRKINTGISKIPKLTKRKKKEKVKKEKEKEEEDKEEDNDEGIVNENEMNLPIELGDSN